MFALPIAEGQIMPPRIKDLLIRRRLQDLGRQILAHSVATIVAPAGYGKSVWVSSLLEDPCWPPTAWLNLERSDAEPSTLLYHLIYAVRRILPGFGADSLRTLAGLSSPARAWPIALAVFGKEVPRDQEFVLTLDDVHLIQENETACAILEQMLRRLPANIHVILIGRNMRSLNLYRQLLGGKLLEVKSAQLLFTLEEARALYNLMGLELPATEIEALRDWTEGWPVGLRLAGIYLRQAGGPAARIIRNLKHDDSSLHRYLSKELLGTFPEQMQDFLLASSLLPFLEPGLCNAAFSRTDSRVRIEQLHDYGLLSRVEGQPVTWRIHHLMGAYLKDSALTLLPPEYIAATRSRAGIFFENRGEIDRAIGQAIAGAAWDRVAALIRKYGYDYFKGTARLDALNNWIDQLPEEFVAENPWLLYFRGTAMMQVDDHQAIDVLSRAARIAAQKADLRCEAFCLLGMIHSAVFLGDLNTGRDVGRRLTENKLLLEDPRSQGAALVTALWYAMWTDDLQEGLRLSRQALLLRLDPELKASAVLISAYIHFRTGNLVQAQKLAESALDLPFMQENEHWTVTGLVILACIFLLMGDQPAREATGRKLLQLGRKYHMPVVIGRIHMFQAWMHYREGRIAEGLQEYKLAHNCFSECGSVSFANLMALEMIPLRIRNGENAGDLMEEMQDLLLKLEAFPYGQGFETHILSIGGIVAMEAGSLELAGQLFERSARRWRQIGARQNLAGTSLLQAHLHLLQGDEETADSLLRSSLAATEAGQWLNFWEWHDETVYTMCHRALLKNICSGWALNLLQRWFPLRLRHEVGFLLLSPERQLQTFTAAFFQNAALETGSPIIHSFFL